MSKFKHQTLLDGHHVPLSPDLVKAFGPAAAYALTQLHYWEQNPASAGWKCDDGHNWVYNSIKAWAEQLGLTEAQARNTFKKLRDTGVVLAKKIKARLWDQRLGYRIDREALKKHMVSLCSAFAKFSESKSENEQIEASKSSNDLTNTSSKNNESSSLIYIVYI